MSDIVERLRAGVQCDEAGNRCRTMDARSGCVCAEAADTITSLRAQLKTAVWSDSEECTFLTAEVERLRAALFEIYKSGLYSQGGAYKSGFYSNFKIARRALGIPHMSFDSARAALDEHHD